jgi:hypothetical protein
MCLIRVRGLFCQENPKFLKSWRWEKADSFFLLKKRGGNKKKKPDLCTGFSIFLCISVEIQRRDG